MAEKAGLLWPRLPRKLGRGQACQALPGCIFLVSLAKTRKALAWLGFARLAGFLTGLLMQRNGTTVKIKSKIHSVEFAVYEAFNICKKAVLQKGDDNFCPECSKPRRRSANILVSYHLQTLGTLVSTLKW